MLLTCPYCGLRDQSEFTYRGDANARRPSFADESIEAHAAYVFDRENPSGLHEEIWNHTSGCRNHIKVVRNVTTHEVVSCEPVGPFAKALKRGRAT
ncbi:MAG: sarcosine oxidase subunit delta [Ahrensia sp.]|nr:sarcosine oxidase subunit delta [Ahrensia sp.]